MARCQACQGTEFIDGRAEDEIKVGSHRFVTLLDVKTCVSCHTPLFEASDIRAFEREVAHTLADSGVSTGAAFRFMRKSVPLRAVDLAELLDMTPEMISKYENDHAPIDRRALSVLAAMVEDALSGSTRTRDRLVAMREPPKLARAIRIDLSNEKTHAAR
ncbi:MAG: hypothetical protein NVS3B10_04340 [Polyangiales bacterium]